jgi:Protein of unknown function (DUF1553)/Protein of unknown function (DUF1549)/Planctomycete cytochrome C
VLIKRLPYFFLFILGLISSCTSPTERLPTTVSYNFDIRPIISDKCFACHGPDENKREAGLSLFTEEGLFASLKDFENRYVITKGNSEQSELYLRVSSEDPEMMMPPPESGHSLSQRDIKLIKKWIEQGAEYESHWAFTPPKKAPVPEINDDWVTNEIDQFVFAKLDEIGLTPNGIADKEHLLKRAAFDLTGLPATIDLQERFLNDDSPEAYEKLLDELLGSERYGEKMAVHWLDVARYADSHGYQDDGLRTMWPWRDWVIHAFNENYPYDKFLTWQLAGDLIPEKNKESLLATGFNRNHKITQEGGVIDEEYRIEYVTDRTNTFGKAFLGLTFECAKCHDHKFDPISQKNYFETFAFFDKVPEKGLYGLFDASFADPPNMAITDEDIDGILSFVNKVPTDTVSVMVMEDSVGIRDTHVLNRGNYYEKAEVVFQSTPEAVLAFDTTKFKKNRAGLAEWLLDEENPLTSRIFVNRIWQEIFGRGIVKTSGDFGLQGDLPTHPELLDWLAIDFKENDWDIKRLMKQIMMSATYTQSSTVDKHKLSKDPDNLYLSWKKRKRFSAETIRDFVLASSGLLNPKIGGPSVKPYQPDGIWKVASSGRGILKTYVQDHDEDLYRRGMYTFIKRTVPPPTMLMFDSSPRDLCEVRRQTTNTPLQALIMLNDPTVLEAARVLAEQLLKEKTSVEDKIQMGYRLILGRKASTEEITLMIDYHTAQLEYFGNSKEQAEQFVTIGEHPLGEISDKSELAALMQMMHTIYNLEEAITKT